MDFKSEILIILCWIAIWGIVENLLNIYIDINNYKARLLIHFLLLLFLLALKFQFNHSTTQ